MPKGKLVRRVKNVDIPKGWGSIANRDLTTYEKATSWMGPDGLIYADEGIERVFDAAVIRGRFSVITKGALPGALEREDFRFFAAAMMKYIHLTIQQRRPLLYAYIDEITRDSLIAAAGYKDKASGTFISREEATADVLEYFYRRMCKSKGWGPHQMLLDSINLLRPKRRIVRERLPTKIKRERL